jgi:DNA-binding transcriptional LysR family regulator
MTMERSGRMNKLLSMLTFVRVAESGSFTAAAEQLGVSVSAVAKAISRLEQELDSQLLVRSTRKIALNEDGRAFYGRCRQILNDIEDAETSVKSARHLPRGRLRIAMPVLFGRRTFLPRVAEFSAAYPEIVLDLAFEDRRIDLIERGIDVAVQVGELRDSGYITRMLNRGPRLTAASPAYLKRCGEPQTPADLATHNCVTGWNAGVWDFQDNGRAIEIPVSGNLVVTGGEAMREAALLGLGIVQTNWWTLSSDIAEGRLKALLERYAVDGRPLSVVYPPTRHLPHKVRVMVDFLVEITRLPTATERALLTRRRVRRIRK